MERAIVFSEDGNFSSISRHTTNTHLRSCHQSDLGVQDGFRAQRRQHLVERVEKQVDVDPEGVLVLTPGGPGEQDPGLDDELGDELERPEALLDRLLQLGGGRQVGAVPHAADETPVKTQIHL